MPKGDHKRKFDQHEEEVRKLIEVDLLTQDEVARRLGVNRTTVQKWCKRFSLKTQRTGPRVVAHPPGWQGGMHLVGRYWYVHVPDHPRRTKQGCVAQHRLMMERKLGRFLLPTEAVHHIDGNPQNNEIENLMLFENNSEHLRHELTGRVPQWSENGKARIVAAAQKSAAIRRRTKSYDDLHIPPSDRQPLSVDSNDAPQACEMEEVPKP